MNRDAPLAQLWWMELTRSAKLRRVLHYNYNGLLIDAGPSPTIALAPEGFEGAQRLFR